MIQVSKTDIPSGCWLCDRQTYYHRFSIVLEIDRPFCLACAFDHELRSVYLNTMWYRFDGGRTHYDFVKSWFFEG